MHLDQLDAFVAIVLAGSLAMERVVTIAKTLLPSTFGPPGPQPTKDVSVVAPTPMESVTSRLAKRRRAFAQDDEQQRRILVLSLVLLSSLVTSWLLSERPETCTSWTARCRSVNIGAAVTINWFLYALLISGGSALWTNILGTVSALKDVQVEQRRHGSTDVAPAGAVLVIDRQDKPVLEIRAHVP